MHIGFYIEACDVYFHPSGLVVFVLIKLNLDHLESKHIPPIKGHITLLPEMRPSWGIVAPLQTYIASNEMRELSF